MLSEPVASFPFSTTGSVRSSHHSSKKLRAPEPCPRRDTRNLKPLPSVRLPVRRPANSYAFDTSLASMPFLPRAAS
jgi:hypothetical protein